MSTDDDLIYHAALARDYSAGRAYAPPAFVTEGFVHLSPSAEAAVAAANRYLTGQSGKFVLLSVKIDELPASALKWEGSFPHCYTAIPVAAVVSALQMSRAGAGGESGVFTGVVAK
jgi:uncharacterized protein (DUF952 family)